MIDTLISTMFIFSDITMVLILIACLFAVSYGVSFVVVTSIYYVIDRLK